MKNQEIFRNNFSHGANFCPSVLKFSNRECGNLTKQIKLVTASTYKSDKYRAARIKCG